MALIARRDADLKETVTLKAEITVRSMNTLQRYTRFLEETGLSATLDRVAELLAKDKDFAKWTDPVDGDANLTPADDAEIQTPRRRGRKPKVDVVRFSDGLQAQDKVGA